MKFPFTVYRIIPQVYIKNAEIPSPEYNCQHCGNKCGHRATVIRYEKQTVIKNIIQDYTVVGAGDEYYFYYYNHQDYSGHESIDTIPIEGSYLSKEEAQKELEKLKNETKGKEE